MATIIPIHVRPGVYDWKAEAPEPRLPQTDSFDYREQVSSLFRRTLAAGYLLSRLEEDLAAIPGISLLAEADEAVTEALDAVRRAETHLADAWKYSVDPTTGDDWTV